MKKMNNIEILFMFSTVDTKNYSILQNKMTSFGDFVLKILFN